ncbi:MAG: hypothetical protein MMC33_005938 [Icmadophila ericetorum]|nr:hypothetical protein [Icmadophila ericetorum]
MREVNFSIPNVNKASVGITTALYDRRALDCTSTLPLINSLNHLAYLTTSSARIRDILTVDGGVERLVCILKQGRSREMMEMWKWNLAFQCVVNIGVRGSEQVRTRVVEADMVPVIATILDNYIKVTDKYREKMEAEARRPPLRYTPSRTIARPNNRSSFHERHERGGSISDHRSFRRQAPPPAIEIPQPFPPQQQIADVGSMETTPTPSQLALTSPSTFPRHHHHHHHYHHHHRNPDARYHTHGPAGTPNRHPNHQILVSALPTMEPTNGLGLRSIPDRDRLPSMLPALQSGITSQPESPTTPNAPTLRPMTMHGRNRRRPSIRHHLSTSGDSDDATGDGVNSQASTTNDVTEEPMLDIQTTVNIQGAEDQEAILNAVTTPLTFDGTNGSEGQEAETFNITHRSVLDGSIINTNITPTNNPIGVVTVPQPLNVASAPQTMVPQNVHARYLLDRSAPAGVLAATPRDEDVLMSLQLLAYVSKYCNLRTYFQQSHLVPKLKIGYHLQMLDDNPPTEDCSHLDESQEEEYLLPDDFNIFPLVEKFTMIQGEVFVSVRIMSVVNGSSGRDNSPSAGDAGEQNIAAKNARRTHGYTIDTGVR